MSKRALLVGCNYPGSENALQGCVNDVFKMKEMLLTRFGFAEENIVVMIDTDKKYPQPTGANIRKALGKIVTNTRSGDVLVMHFSGHGVQIPAESGIPDDTGFDECICPTDMNLLTDDDFRDIVNKVPKGVTFTFISDSCHSGGLIDHEKEQIGNSTTTSSGMNSRAFDLSSYKASRECGGNVTREFHLPKHDESVGRRGYSDRDEGDNRGERQYGGYKERREENHGFDSRYESHKVLDEHHGPPRYESHKDDGKHIYGSGQGVSRPSQGGYSSNQEEDKYGRKQDTRGGDSSGSAHGSSQEQGSRFLRNRGLALPDFMSMLGKVAGRKVGEGAIRTTLYSVFGKESSPMVQMFVGILVKHGPEIMETVTGTGNKKFSLGGLLSEIAVDFVMSQAGSLIGGQHTSQAVAQATPIAQHTAAAGDDAPLLAGWKPPPENRVDGHMGILISGCQSKETSADACKDGNPKNAFGALSNAIQTVVSQKQGRITTKELVMEVRKLLKKQGYEQNPGLYCSDDNSQTAFICEI